MGTRIFVLILGISIFSCAPKTQCKFCWVPAGREIHGFKCPAGWIPVEPEGCIIAAPEEYECPKLDETNRGENDGNC